MNPKNLKRILLLTTIAAIITMGFRAPISQDLSYHSFADVRLMFGIANFWNVASNLGFVMVGFMGLYQLFVTRRLMIVAQVKTAYSVFFIGVALVVLGSGFYHFAPSNATLIWDRLPMTVAFMALLSMVFAEFLSVVWARRSLWPLLGVGLASAVYWYYGELHGVGDLRAYVLVQFLPVVLIVLLLIFGQNVFNAASGYAWLLASYVLAKACEHFDAPIFQITHGVMAGHALKHVLAALGLYALLRCMMARRLRHG